ncbi:hypothetical protein ACFQZS_05445 [Mucilaginibacter calamicampi]|uniref:Uncharacterized protein n=1 Tax=Mucilaginibacter calamicampi TaxID=1302352 RepID=A0ABW2YW50_9SPHI
MDFNVVALEVSDLIAHFDYYDRLITNVIVAEEQTRLRNKNQDHLAKFFAGVEFYNDNNQLRPLYETKDQIIFKLKSIKTNDVHDLVEKLEKDAKKIKKLYKSLHRTEA